MNLERALEKLEQQSSTSMIHAVLTLVNGDRIITGYFEPSDEDVMLYTILPLKYVS